MELEGNKGLFGFYNLLLFRELMFVLLSHSNLCSDKNVILKRRMENRCVLAAPGELGEPTALQLGPFPSKYKSVKSLLEQ